MTTDTIHLEGYSSNLRKQKIYCFGDVNTLDKMYQGLLNMYSEEVLKSHKVVVIFSDIYVKHNPKWLRNILVDAIYRIKDSKDLQLAYTYIQHCAKPLLIVWYSNEIPQVIFSNLNSTKEDITLITGGTNIRYDYRPFCEPDNCEYNIQGSQKQVTLIEKIYKLYIMENIPNKTIYWGETDKTLEEVYLFEQHLEKKYILGINDCRHYVNRISRWAVNKRTPIWGLNKLWNQI